MTRRLLVLVRHGATSASGRKTYVGQRDLPIDAEGTRQALRLRRMLASWSFDIAFCSDLTRCRQTAGLILDGRDIEIVPRADLREPSMGEWEGCGRDDIAAAFPAEHALREQDLFGHRPPGGESFADCLPRVNGALADVLARIATAALVVGHGNVNRLLLCQMLGMPPANLFRLGQDHGCLNIVRIGNDGYRVLRMNILPS